MAHTTFASSLDGVLTPYVTPPSVDRVATGLPWGEYQVNDVNRVAAVGAGDTADYQMSFNLPNNYVARLTHFYMFTRLVSGGNLSNLGGAALQVAATPLNKPFISAYTKDYSLVQSSVRTALVNGGASQQTRWFGPGWTQGSASNELTVAPQFLNSLLLQTDTGSVVLTLFDDDGNTGVIDVNVLAKFSLYTIDQANHVMVNQPIPLS